MVALLLLNNSSLCQNNRATVTRHNYSRWRRSRNLKVATKEPHPLPPSVEKAADRPGHCPVKTNVYFEYNTYYFHPELTLHHPCLEGFFVRLK